MTEPRTDPTETFLRDKFSPLVALYYFPPETGAELVTRLAGVERALARRVTTKAAGIARATRRSDTYNRALRIMQPRVDELMGASTDGGPF